MWLSLGPKRVSREEGSRKMSCIWSWKTSNWSRSSTCFGKSPGAFPSLGLSSVKRGRCYLAPLASRAGREDLIQDRAA